MRDFEEFVTSVGTVVYRETLDFDPSGGYSEGGDEIAIVRSREGMYKLIVCAYSNDPWGPARFNEEEQMEILNSPWLTEMGLIIELAESAGAFYDNYGGEEAYLEALAVVDATPEDVPPPDVDGFMLALVGGGRPASGRASSAAFAAGLVYADYSTRGRVELTAAGWAHVGQLRL